MSVSSTSPRSSTITTGIAQTSTDTEAKPKTAVPLGSSAGGSSSSGDTAGDHQQGAIGGSSGDGSPSSSGEKHKKTTPPKKPSDRNSPTMRPRSTSQPILMVSPLQHKPSQTTLKPQPAPKSLHSPPGSPRSPRALQRTATVNAEPRKLPEVSGNEAASETLSHTAPTLNASEKDGKAQRRTKEQAAIDIADLIDKHLVCADGSGNANDFSVTSGELSPALKKLVRHQKDDTFTLGKLLGLLFSKTLRDSEGWSKAHDMYIRFKIKADGLNKMLQSDDEKQMNEAKLIIESFAASIAGSFFTLSRLEKLTRLPGNLVSFLQQVDHRQLRKLLNDAQPPSDPHQLDTLRTSRLANVLIDHCLTPELNAAFTGNAEDRALLILHNEIKRSLHGAFIDSGAKALLTESLKNAPDSLTTRFSQWRIQQLKDSAPTRSSSKESRGHKGTMSEIPISPRESAKRQVQKLRQERKEWLSKQLNWVSTALHPLAMPEELLKAIKAKNREWIGSRDPLKLEVILLEWQKLVDVVAPESGIAGVLRKLLDDELSKQAEIADIQAAMVGGDLSSLVTDFLGGKLTPHRGRPLSGWLDTSAPDDTAMATTTTSVMPATIITTTSSANTTTTTTTTTATTTLAAPAHEPSMTSTAALIDALASPRLAEVLPASPISSSSAPGGPVPARKPVPPLNLRPLTPVDNSPYKPPLTAVAQPAVIRPLPPLPASAPVSPGVSANVSPVSTPPLSPEGSPRSPRKLVEGREGVALNSLRRKLTQRRVRTGSQPVLPVKESPRAQVMKPVTTERLLVLQDYAAALINAMRASAKDGKLKQSMIKSLGRMDIMISVDKLPASLQPLAQTILTSRISSSLSTTNTITKSATTTTATTTTKPGTTTIKNATPRASDDKVSQSSLFRQLTRKSLTDSDAGSTVLAMKKIVMGILKGNELSYDKWEAMNNADEVKNQSLEAMTEHANATVDISFGQPPSLAKSKLPSDLLALWKEADRLLLEWASENSELSNDLIVEARSWLGFDLVITRSIYALAGGGEDAAELVVPRWFADKVYDMHRLQWPAFFNDFMRVVDAERSAKPTPSE